MARGAASAIASLPGLLAPDFDWRRASWSAEFASEARLHSCMELRLRRLSLSLSLSLSRAPICVGREGRPRGGGGPVADLASELGALAPGRSLLGAGEGQAREGERET